MTIDIRTTEQSGPSVWARLRRRLWPEMSDADNAEDLDRWRGGRSALKIVFLAFEGETAIGFAEIGERSIADGCGHDPVAYLEGWYVEPAFQGRGVGRALIEQAAEWARSSGYCYLASDTELGNAAGLQGHRSAGFEETGRVIQFRRALR